MIRRSRISVRPNVGAGGRTSQDAPPLNPTEPAVSLNPTEPAVSLNPTEPAVSLNTTEPAVEVGSNANATDAVLTTTAQGDSNENSVESTASSASVQRRKRVSIKPKVTPTANRTSVRASKSALADLPECPVEPPGSHHEEATAARHVVDPVAQREDAEQSGTQSKSSHGTPAAAVSESPTEPTECSSEKGRDSERPPVSPAKEVPPKPPDKVPPSLPEKEAMEISERAKTLVSRSSKDGQSLPSKLCLSQLLHDQTDLQRIAKARRLRELLRREMEKEKKHKKSKARVKEYVFDPSKMTMRDLVHYLPNSNPMTSYLEDSTQENETVVPPSPAREESPEKAQDPELARRREGVVESDEEVAEDGSLTVDKERSPEKAQDPEEEDDEEAGEKDEALMVPRVKVAEDGSLIVDEESLMVEVKRAKGPNPAEARDAIFERGSLTTYSSFRKRTYTKSWSIEETDMFYLAVGMVGTDFSLICQLFPHRSRSEIKNKFKKEERENAWRIDKAFKERRRLDLKFFSKLLERILECQSRKSRGRKAIGRPRKKANGRTVKELSDVEEDPFREEEDEDEEPPEPAASASADTRTESDSSTVKQKGKNAKREQGEASIPEDTEAALPEDHSAVDGPDDAGPAAPASDANTKPAPLARSRAAKPPLRPSARKLGKQGKAAPAANSEDVPDPMEACQSDPPTAEQVHDEESPLTQVKKRKPEGGDAGDSSEDEEDSAIKPVKPTRYGRMPKPIQHLNYPAKEDAASPRGSEASADSASSARPSTSGPSRPKPPAHKAKSSKSAQESKKRKLVTLRASQSDCSDDDEDQQREPEEEEAELSHPSCPAKDSSAPVFVPVSLRSPRPVVSEVEETVEELDILVNVPDVLDISQDISHEASCEHAPDEADTVPFEHSLDLLADVIDFLSPEYMEVSDNEAAQTLLTIGNRSHNSCGAQDDFAAPDNTTVGPTACGTETLRPMDGLDAVAEVQSSSLIPPAVTSDATPPVDAARPANGGAADDGPAAETEDVPVTGVGDESRGRTVPASDAESGPRRESSGGISAESAPPPSKRARLPKFKPRPNLVRSSRTAPPLQQPVTSQTEQPVTSQTAPPVTSQTEQPVTSQVEDHHMLGERNAHSSEETLSQPMAEGTFSVPSVPQSPVTEDLPTSVIGLEEEAPARQEEAADTESTLELESQLETPEESPPRSAKDASLESTVQSEPATYSPLSRSNDDDPPGAVSAKGESPQEKGSEVVPTGPTRRRQFAKVKPKPNLGRRVRAVPSEPDPTGVARPIGSRPSSELQSPEDEGTQVKPPPTRGATDDSKPPAHSSPTSPSSIKTGSVLVPADAGCTREEKTTSGGYLGRTESPGRAESRLQAAGDDKTSQREDLRGSSDVHSEAPLVLDDSELGTMMKASGRVTSPRIPRLSEQHGVANCESAESQRSREDETTSLGASKSPSYNPDAVEGGAAKENDADQRVASKDVSVAQIESRAKRGDAAPTRRRRCLKVKPTPNLGQSSRGNNSKQRPLEDPFIQSNPDVRNAPNAGSTTQLADELTLNSHNEHPAPLRASSTSQRLSPVVLPALEVSPNPPVERACIPTALPLEKMDGPEFTACERSTGEFNSERMESERCDSSLAQKPFSTTDSAVAEIFPNTLAAVAPPVGSEETEVEPFPQKTCDVKSGQRVEVALDSSKRSDSHSQAGLKEDTPKKSCSHDVVKTDEEICDMLQDQETNNRTKDGYQEADLQSKALKLDQTVKGAPSEPTPNHSWQSLSPHSTETETQPDAERSQDPPSHRQDTRTLSSAVQAEESAVESPPQLQGADHLQGVDALQRETQGYSIFATHPALTGLPEQMPADPDEPFFILSLTEIPVFPSGEGTSGASEPGVCPSPADAPAPPQSDPPAPAAAASSAGEGALCRHAPVPASTEVGVETAAASANNAEPSLKAQSTDKQEDPHDHAVSQAPPPEAVTGTIENYPPHKKRRTSVPGKQGNTPVQPPEISKAAVDTEENEPPQKKRRTSVPVRKATSEVQPRCSGKRQTRRSSVTETTPAQNGSVDPPEEAVGHVESRPAESRAADIEPAEKTSPLKRPGRKPKGFLAFLSDTSTPSSGRPASKVKAISPAPRVKASRTAGEQGPRGAAATKRPLAPVSEATEGSRSDVPSVAGTATLHAPPELAQASPEEQHFAEPMPSTSGWTTEVPVAEQYDTLEMSSLDGEPTNVSQYFLSDIFTEVDE